MMLVFLNTQSHIGFQKINVLLEVLAPISSVLFNN